MTLKIKRIKDYVVELEGKNTLVINEVIKFRNNVKGIVMYADENRAKVALLEMSIENPLIIGDVAYSSGNEYSIKVKETYLGNIISVDDKVFTEYQSNEEIAKTYDSKQKEVLFPIFRIARPIFQRDFVNKPLLTGLAAVDWTIPIGKGQRELILGDRKTGKTSIALNVILAQAESDVICIYVAIGQKKTTILDVYEKLEKNGMLDRTIIIAASADQVATKKWLAPFVGITIAEYFQNKYGKDVLIIYDDLSKHADAYRELSLLLNSAPAREAFPGDIFYLHSKLLERAGRFDIDYGGGSITALPIVQTEGGDITSYIPTNIISITDGQIFTSKSLFNSGQRPAIDVPYSVSRVGSAAQTKLVADVSKGLKLLVSQYEEVKKMVRLSGQVTKDNKEIMDKGRVFTSLLVQSEGEVFDSAAGVLILSLFKRGYFDFFKTLDEVKFVKKIINQYLKKDFLGVKISFILKSGKDNLSKKMLELAIQESILPIIKYQLLEKYHELRQNEDFIKIYSGVRSDGRVFNVFKKQLTEVA